MSRLNDVSGTGEEGMSPNITMIPAKT